MNGNGRILDSRPKSGAIPFILGLAEPIHRPDKGMSAGGHQTYGATAGSTSADVEWDED